MTAMIHEALTALAKWHAYRLKIHELRALSYRTLPDIDLQQSGLRAAAENLSSADDGRRAAA